MTTIGRWVRIAVAVVAVLAIAGLIASTGCGAPADRSLPPPKSTSSTEPVPSTTRPDYSQVALVPVDGATTTVPLITQGDAAIRGVVTGPEGPLPEAIVRFERLVGEAVQRTDVRAGPDGRYELVGVPGGRYRVRAYLPPSLTSQQTEVFYLVDGEQRDLQLPTVPFTGLVVRSSTTPSAPVVGGGANLAVRVAQREVDGEGVGRETPVPGIEVRVSATGWTALDDDPRAVTDGQGVAVFEYRCDEVGPVSATAVISVTRRVDPDPEAPASPEESTQTVDEVFPLDVPPCAPRPTTTTTTTTTAPSSSTSSTTTAA